jgi:hypothetical protein
MPVPPPCVTLLAIHGDTELTTNQIPIATNTEGRVAMAQRLTIADKDKELPVTLSIMRRTLGFPSATPLVAFHRAV